jgi:hypothetical protein
LIGIEDPWFANFESALPALGHLIEVMAGDSSFEVWLLEFSGLNGDLADELIGLAQIDGRFRIGRGSTVGLLSWPEKRHSISDVIQQVMDGASRSSFEEIHTRVEAMIERPVRRESLPYHLGRLGFVYDSQAMEWIVAPQTEDE